MAEDGSSRGGTRWRPLTGIVVGMLLVTSAQACPRVVRSFFVFSGRTKEAEARANLKLLCLAEVAYRGAHGAFDADLRRIGFSPERGNRYAYYAAPTGGVELRAQALASDAGEPPHVSIVSSGAHLVLGSLPPTDPALTGCPLTTLEHSAGDPASRVRFGLGVSADGGAWVGLAAGNLGIDADPDLDCWSVASVERRSRHGERIEACVPYHEQDFFEPKQGDDAAP